MVLSMSQGQFIFVPQLAGSGRTHQGYCLRCSHSQSITLRDFTSFTGKERCGIGRPGREVLGGVCVCVYECYSIRNTRVSDQVKSDKIAWKM